jgi:hypothetical protein
MRKFLFVVAAVCVSSIFAGPARAQVEVYGGFSFVRPSVTYTQSIAVCTLPPGQCSPSTPQFVVTSHPNLSGWELTGVYNFYRWIGLAADFGANYGNVRGATTHFHSYLFGPQIRLPGPISPFAHALVGVANQSIGGLTNDGFFITPKSPTSFAAALGAGLDLKLVPIVAVRVIQLDDLITDFNGAHRQLRASAGLVLHF